MINRTTLRLLKEDIDAALAAVGTKHNVLLTLGAGRFTSDHATMTLTATVASAAATAAVEAGVAPKDVKARSDFLQFAAMFGMKPEWLDRSFRIHGKEVKIVGLLPNKRKNNVLIEGTSGGRYICSPTDVRIQ